MAETAQYIVTMGYINRKSYVIYRIEPLPLPMGLSDLQVLFQLCSVNLLNPIYRNIYEVYHFNHFNCHIWIEWLFKIIRFHVRILLSILLSSSLVIFHDWLLLTTNGMVIPAIVTFRV